MIIELELGAVIALLACQLRRAVVGGVTLAAAPASGSTAAESTPTPVLAEAPAAGPRPVVHHAGEIELLKRNGAGWLLVGHRNADHPDYHEALRTAGLAVRHPDGTLYEGAD